MTFVTALMFAFNSILFSRDVQELFEVAGLMAAMVGIATFFIVLIVAWLINYMIRFMLEKRSQEFGIYLLLGMKKKKIASLYMRENLLMGTGAFFLGMLLGTLLQQIIMSVLYSMIQMKYDLHLEFNRYCILMTAACYAGCYLLALFRCRRRFKKMNIHDLMNANKQNEEIKESNEKLKRWLLPVSILFMLAFGVFLFCGLINNAGSVILFLVGLILVIYLFYTGLSSWIICYVRAKGKGIYKGQNLFLLRQFSSKLKTMRFTMGTLTSLFTIAFLGCSIAMMFSDWQNQVLGDKFPFDVQVYSADVNDDFQDELKIIGKESDIEDALSTTSMQARPIRQTRGCIRICKYSGTLI
ncbi:MAG: FtsX-like permease family protein [[Clostridium] scindens]